MGYVRTKIGLIGQFDPRQPGNYLQPCNSYLCFKLVHFMQRDWVKTLGLKLISTDQQKHWTEYTSLIAKTTCPGLLDITFFACCYIQTIPPHPRKKIHLWVWKMTFLVINRVRIWTTGRHSNTKNSQEYPSGGGGGAPPSWANSPPYKRSQVCPSLF